MNFKPAHPRETILEALEELNRAMIAQIPDSDIQIEAIDIIDRAKVWAHRATIPEERDGSPAE